MASKTFSLKIFTFRNYLLSSTCEEAVMIADLMSNREVKYECHIHWRM